MGDLLKSVGKTCRNHWVMLIVLSVVIGSLYMSYHVAWFITKYHRPREAIIGSYSPIALRDQKYGKNDQVIYLSQAAYLSDGHWGWKLGDPYVYEYRNTPTPVPIITATCIALVIKVVGNVEFAYILVKTVSFAVVLLSVYLLVFYATRSVQLALATSMLSIILSRPAELIFEFANVNTFSLLQSVIPPSGSYVSRNFSRIPYNAVTFPWLLAAIGATARALDRQTRGAAIVSGIFLGAQAMVYPYFATSWALGLPFLLLLFVLRREWGMSKALVLSGAVGLVVSTPALIVQFQISHLPQYTDILKSLSSTEMGFDWKSVPLLLVVVLMWGSGSLIPGKWQLIYLITLSVMLGASLCLNLHYVVGYNLQSFHWNLRVFQPLFLLAICLLIGMALRTFLTAHGNTQRWVLAGPVITTIIVTYGIAKIAIDSITPAYETHSEYISYDERRGYEWLAQHAEHGSVALSIGPQQILLFRLLARVYTYLPHRAISVLPADEAVNRWASACRFFGMRPAFFDTLVEHKVAPPWSYEIDKTNYVIFHLTYGYWADLKDSTRAYVRQKFDAVADPDSAIRQFRVDYIWQGPYERAVGIDSLEKVRNVELAFESGGVRIYRVMKEQERKNR